MSIRCPTCGRDNRDGASFCAGCGRRDLQTSALQPHMPVVQPRVAPAQPGPLALQHHAPTASQPPGSLMSQHPAALAATASGRPRLVRARTPILAGVIEAYNQDEVYPLADVAWVLARIAIGVAVLPVALSFFAGLGMLLIAIIVLGGGIILAIFGGMIGAFAKLFSLLMPRRRPVERKLTQVHLIVQERHAGQGAAVLYGDHIAGMLHKGDEVAIYGRRERSGLVRAVRVEVVGAQFAAGAVARRVVKGKRTFPVAVTLSLWAIALVAWSVLYVPAIMRLLP